MVTKRCSKCRAEKEPIEFYKNATSRDGLQSACKPCSIAAAKEWNTHNPERKTELDRAWRVDNQEHAKEHRHTWYAQNTECQKGRTRAWAAANLERAKEATRTWRADNRGKVNAATMRRNAAKLQSTPKWGDPAAIVAIYVAAHACGLTADHIVPLQSKIVCGLHCEFNLQLLSKNENSKKSNRYWPDMP